LKKGDEGGFCNKKDFIQKSPLTLPTGRHALFAKERHIEKATKSIYMFYKRF